MIHCATPLKILKSSIFVLTMLAATPAALAGDGTIPLRMTGSVVGSPADGIASRTETTESRATIRRLIKIPSHALKCLSGSDVKKYRAHGHLEINGTKQTLLAICYRSGTGILELLSVDLKDPNSVTRFRGKATRE